MFVFIDFYVFVYNIMLQLRLQLLNIEVLDLFETNLFKPVFNFYSCFYLKKYFYIFVI